MFRTLAPFALFVPPAAAQIHGPPIPPPGNTGAVLSGVHHSLEIQQGIHELLTTSFSPQQGREILLYRIDAAGDVTLRDRLFEDGVTVQAFGPDRIVGTVDYQLDQVRVYERIAGVWTTGPTIVGGNVANTAYGFSAAIDGTTLALADPANSEVDFFDLSVVGLATPIGSASIPAGRFPRDMRMDGDTLIAKVGRPTGPLVPVMFHVFERDTGGWSLTQTLQEPSGAQWPANDLSIDLDGDRIAIAQWRVDGPDPCGRVYLYERGPGGFAFDSEMRGNGPCRLSTVRGTEFGVWVELAGDEMVVHSRYGGVAERFERRTSGWRVVSRYALASNLSARTSFAGPLVLATSQAGVEVYDTNDTGGRVVPICPTATTTTEFVDWVIEPSFRLTTEVDDVVIDLIVDEPTLAPQPMILHAGMQRGMRMFGPESTLCLGGRMRRLVMPGQSGGFPFIVSIYRLTLDPTTIGVGAGDTVFFQAWRSEPGVLGGITSSAYALTFAP